jgi:hypothetical protein
MTTGNYDMNKDDYTPLYQFEDELISVRIGKPRVGDGAFLAFNGNIQFGFVNDQYEDMLIPLLRAIDHESIEGTFKFYRCQNGDYRLQSHALMLVLDNSTGEALKNHVKKALHELLGSD